MTTNPALMTAIDAAREEENKYIASNPKNAGFRANARSMMKKAITDHMPGSEADKGFEKRCPSSKMANAPQPGAATGNPVVVPPTAGTVKAANAGTATGTIH